MYIVISASLSVACKKPSFGSITPFFTSVNRDSFIVNIPIRLDVCITEGS